MLWFFSNEKNFSQDPLHNTQNNQWIVIDAQEVPWA